MIVISFRLIGDQPDSLVRLGRLMQVRRDRLASRPRRPAERAARPLASLDYQRDPQDGQFVSRASSDGRGGDDLPRLQWPLFVVSQLAGSAASAPRREPPRFDWAAPPNRIPPPRVTRLTDPSVSHCDTTASTSALRQDRAAAACLAHHQSARQANWNGEPAAIARANHNSLTDAVNRPRDGAR
jgi:hypothetical protein